MAEDQDDAQKTEEPTRKRLEEAAKKGQLVFSREIGNFFVLFTFTISLMWILPHVARDSMGIMTRFLSDANDFEMDAGSIGAEMIELLKELGAILIVPLLVFIIAALFSNILQNKINLTAEPIMPKLEKISPLKGLERMFSMRSLVEFIKGIIKITIVGVLVTMAVWPYLNYIPTLADESIRDIIAFALSMATRMLVGVCCVMFLIAIVDYLYQYFEYMKSMRMTKQEVKDEYRQQEGDPHVKQRLRSIRMERARKRMMQNVPKADVVITNPTHYAVALKYEQENMRAPTVMAKGMDFMALHIRKLAEENDVPLVENPPLAQALYASVDIGKEIPFEHYKAVAEVISYVYRLKGKVPPGQQRAS